MASPAHLLDLPPDLLIRIGAQLPFAERLRLSLVCRRWREACAGPSELWGNVDARIDVLAGIGDEHDMQFTAYHKLDAFRL